ncbi:LysM peptidoglycan-binding domain-containing protein [Embleya sp. NBC_00896]|nr:LysM peptidoglycan-binding domain-containing protein [Embleya sp. NBC_00896]
MQHKQSDTATKAGPKSAASKQASTSGRYTVKAGDTLSDIASKNGVKGGWKALYNANKSAIGDNPNLINIGAKLAFSA